MGFSIVVLQYGMKGRSAQIGASFVSIIRLLFRAVREQGCNV